MPPWLRDAFALTADPSLGVMLSSVPAAAADTLSSNMVAAGAPIEYRKGRSVAAFGAKWAIQDSNLGPLPYQRSALTD